MHVRNDLMDDAKLVHFEEVVGRAAACGFNGVMWDAGIGGEGVDFDGWTGVGMENGGFDGFAVKAGQKYDSSAFFRNLEGGNKEVRIVLLEPGGRGRQQKILAEQTIVASLNAWQQIPTTLTPTENSSFAVLQLLVLGKGKLDIDQVSLMPQDTYKGHGLRKDLIQALADM